MLGVDRAREVDTSRPSGYLYKHIYFIIIKLSSLSYRYINLYLANAPTEAGSPSLALVCGPKLIIPSISVGLLNIGMPVAALFSGAFANASAAFSISQSSSSLSLGTNTLPLPRWRLPN